VVAILCAAEQTLASASVRPQAPAAQAPASVEERLNRVGSDLFSPTPHPDQAIAALKAILAEAPDLAEGHMLLGMAYQAQGSPDFIGESVAELRQAIALKPSLGLARLALARVYLDTSRATRAREELTAALEIMPDNPELLSVLGETERQLGNPARSVDLNQRALAAKPALLQARYYLGLALVDLHRYPDAIRELQAVVQSGANTGEANLGLGSAYLAAGRTDEAIAALREATRSAPDRRDAHLQLARAYRTKGQLTAALAELQLAAPSGDSALSTLYRDLEIDVRMEEGLIRLRQGRLEQAVQAFEKVLQIDGGHEAAKRQLAEARRRLKERAATKAPGTPK
jgi:tetratricopeptide (TPR) repeat protein